MWSPRLQPGTTKNEQPYPETEDFTSDNYEMRDKDGVIFTPRGFWTTQTEADGGNNTLENEERNQTWNSVYFFHEPKQQTTGFRKISVLFILIRIFYVIFAFNYEEKAK